MSKNAPLYEVRKIRDLKEMLAQSVSTWADAPAFLTKPVRGEPYVPVSYRSYAQDVDCVGTALLGRGIGRGAAVAILSETRYEWYVSYLSVLNGEAIIVPLDKELPGEELRSLLDRAHVRAIFVSPQQLPKLLPLLPELKELDLVILMGDEAAKTDEPVKQSFISFADLREEGRQALADGDKSFANVKIDPEEMRVILFTSGTTARSKGVMHNHRSLCKNLMAMCQMTDVHHPDVALSVLPLHHTYECTCGFLCQLYRGNTVAECEGLRYITKNMAEAKATIILVVPLMLEAFHKRIWSAIRADEKKAKKVAFGLRLSRFLRRFGIDIRRKLFAQIHENFGGAMRMLISGGAAIDPQVLADMEDFGFIAIQGYGLTECAPILALNRDIYSKHESAGLPLPGVDVKVLDPDENGIGEFAARGENLMLGYYEDPERTAEALVDGWFHTGDYGYIDEDGFLIITGRKVNVIVTKNGRNIFPEELEALLNRSEYVLESVVSGKPGRDGDQIVAVEIYPNHEAIAAKLGIAEPTEEQILELLRVAVREVNSQMPSYKAIRDISIRSTEFTKNTSRKIVRDHAKR
ncbi:MAG: AMP-binding protein [Bacillota bacterium]|nr:AMP-binding protein [Bacillota bacterium]